MASIVDLIEVNQHGNKDSSYVAYKAYLRPVPDSIRQEEQQIKQVPV